MARIIDTASVRIQADSRKAERDARRSGARVGKSFADGANSSSSGALQNTIADSMQPLADEGRKAGEKSGDSFLKSFGDRLRRKKLPAPPVDDAEVRMVPIDGPFKKRIQALLKEVEKGAANIPLTAKGETLRRQAAIQVAEVEKTLKGSIPFDPELAAGFRRELDLKVKAASLGVGGNVHIGVDVDRGIVSRVRELVTVGKLASSTFTGIGKAGSAAFGAISESVGTFVSEGVSKLGDLGGVAGSILKGILAFQYVIPAVVTGITLLGGAAIAAFGAIAAGVAGLPVLLTGLIAPIAAVALGMDGLSTAAVNLKQPFADVKKAVTDAFAFDFRPVFDSLQGVVRALGPGLVGIVSSMSFFAKSMADVINTVDGTRKLETALGGVQLMLDRIRFGAVTVFNALLNIAGTQNLYRILGDTIGGVAERFGNMLERMRSSGDLENALRQLQDVLLGVVDMLVVLTEGAVKFFAGAGPGLRKFFQSITEVLSRVDWAGLGASFGGLMERIGKAIQDIPPETWQRLSAGIGDMVDKFIHLMESGALESLINTLSTVLSVLGAIQGALNFISSTQPDEHTFDWVDGIGPKFDSAAGSVGAFATSAASSLGSFFAGFGGFFASVGKSIADFFVNLPTTIGNGLSSLGASITSGLATAGTAVIGFFAALPGQVAYWIGFLGTSMVLSVVDLVQGVVVIFATLPGKVVGFVTDMATRVGEFFAALPGQIGSFASQAVEAVTGFFSQLPGRIGGFVSDMVGRVGRFFGELPGKLLDLAGRAVQAVIDKFSEAPGRVGAKASEIVQKVINFFKELPGKLLQAGRDAISGFIQGVKDKASELYNAAKNVVGNAIRGARDAIAAHSPSRVFMDMGHDSIDGYIIGLRDRMGPARNAMHSLFTSLVDTASAITAGGIDVGALNSNPALSQSVGAGRQVQLTGETIAAAFAFALQQARLVADGQDLALVMNRVQSLQAVR